VRQPSIRAEIFLVRSGLFVHTYENCASKIVHPAR
jgi:hypothetical protein